MTPVYLFSYNWIWIVLMIFTRHWLDSRQNWNGQIPILSTWTWSGLLWSSLGVWLDCNSSKLMFLSVIIALDDDHDAILTSILVSLIRSEAVPDGCSWPRTQWRTDSWQTRLNTRYWKTLVTPDLSHPVILKYYLLNSECIFKVNPCLLSACQALTSI